jgi:uncharacterized membrane protein (DUF485 family)
MDLSEKQKENIFKWTIIVLYILYTIAILGVISYNSPYIGTLRTIIESITCLILIVRFNPYANHIMTNFDKTMIFSVSTFLLCNIIISDVYIFYKKSISQYLPHINA